MARQGIVRRPRPLGSHAEFMRRLGRNLAVGLTVVGAGLTVGSVGYHVTEGLPWLDATLNAAMLLAGEGPIAPLHTTAGKVFATAYAIFSGVVFITAISVLLAPVVHRWLHRFHLDMAGDGEET